MPRLAASDLMDSVLAVRQPLSAPICEKPTTIFLSAAEAAHTAWAAARRNRFRSFAMEFMARCSLLVCSLSKLLGTRPGLNSISELRLLRSQQIGVRRESWTANGGGSRAKPPSAIDRSQCAP